MPAVMLNVVLAHFYSGVGSAGVRPYQWYICVETGRDRRGFVYATAFYITGCQATGFSLEIKPNFQYKMSPDYRGSIRIGAIRDVDFHQLSLRIQEVAMPVPDRYASHYWAYAAMRKLYASRFLTGLYEMEWYAHNLRAAEAAWERGDD